MVDEPLPSEWVSKFKDSVAFVTAWGLASPGVWRSLFLTDTIAAVAFLAAAGAHAGLAYGDFDFLFDSYIILYFGITALSIHVRRLFDIGSI